MFIHEQTQVDRFQVCYHFYYKNRNYFFQIFAMINDQTPTFIIYFTNPLINNNFMYIQQKNNISLLFYL